MLYRYIYTSTLKKSYFCINPYRHFKECWKKGFQFDLFYFGAGLCIRSSVRGSSRGTSGAALRAVYGGNIKISKKA